MVTYNLTQQEKEKVRNGEPVDTKGKTIITELAKGSFNSGGQLAKITCDWQQEIVWQNCSGKKKDGEPWHDQSNISDWGSCSAEVKPNVYIVITGGCNIEELPEVIDYPGGPGSGTGPGGNGNTDPGTPPDDCTIVATDPNQVGIVNPNGCNTGVPTQPNLPTRNNPCQKIKATVNKPQIQDSLIAMKSFAQTSIRTERGFQELKSGTLLSGTVTKKLQVEFGIGPNSLGTIHVHPLKGIAMFSAGDIVTFLHLLREQDASTLGNAYGGMVSASGTYFINFTGTASDIPPAMTEIQEEVYIENLVENYITDKNNLLKLESKIPGQQLSNIGLEKLFFNLLSSMGLDGKISLIKEENGKTSTIQKDSNGNPVPNPC